MSLPYSKAKATLPLSFVEEPTVFFTAAALAKVQYIVQTCNTEVAWFGLVDELDSGDFLITHVYVPEQEVSASTAEIDAAAIVKLVHTYEIDSDALRYHGHSHVNMDVNPSSTDQHHIEDYLEHNDWFIRTISNKKGDMRVDLFDKRSGFTYQNIGYTIWEMAFTDAELEYINLELKNVKTKMLKAPQFNRALPAANAQATWKPSNIGMLPSAEDILEYFGGMTPKERSEEYDLLSLDEQKYFDSLLQMSRL